MKALRALLDRAADRGRAVAFWWRDDDAVSATPALDRLLALARARDLPLAIAAIPGPAQDGLAARLAAEPGADILVHGLWHRNHEPPGAKPAEFGGARPVPAWRAEAGHALRLAEARLGPSLLPVFVPPWNRLAPNGAEALAAAGFRGLSVFGPRRPSDAIAIVNTHLDPVDWRGTRGPVPVERLARQLSEALAGDEPVGLLTHHLTADEALWTAIAVLLDVLADHRAIRWTRARDLWPAASSLNRRQFDDLTYAGDVRGGSSA